MKKIGAPKGGRVHWLLWHLPSDFKAKYMLSYDYDKHNYVFYRMEGKRLYDVFIVFQSSKHYWRMTYVNLYKNVYNSFGYKKTLVLSKVMYDIYLNSEV